MSSFERAHVIIVNSEHTLQEYRLFGGKNSRVLKIAPGVDARRFIPSIDCRNIIDKYDLGGKRVLLTVSRLVKRKGHDLVFKALPIIAEQIPQVTYLIVGSGSQEAHLRTLATELGVADRVVFSGYAPEGDLPSYYNACDVFVMPSRQIEGREGIEGFGIVYLEANACGKPVIGGNSGGVAEAVQDGVTGFLVDPLDHHAFASAVTKLLCDHDLARRLGMQGRERVEREFAWEKQASRLRNALEEALQ
jgi:phosphatidylinositol alpha-1,6-mannosyltransferase